MKMKFNVGSTYVAISFPFIAVMCLMFMMIENSLGTIIAFLLHESAHVAMILLFKGKVKSIQFSLCEMNIKTNKEFFNNIQKFVVAVSGATMNFLLALIFHFYNKDFSYTNIVVGSFQLLPVMNFDGESALEAIGVGETVRKVLSIITSFVLAFIGFYVLLQTKYNFSVLFISIYLLFVSFTCKNE